MKNIIFLSGPITGRTDYMSRFAERETILRELGYLVVNPARICAQFQPTDMFTHDQYCDITVGIMKNCNTIYMMRGWEESTGCCRELKEAIKRGMTVEFEDENDTYRAALYSDNPSLDSACIVDLSLAEYYQWLDSFSTLFVSNLDNDGHEYYIFGDNIEFPDLPWEVSGGVIILDRPIIEFRR